MQTAAALLAMMPYPEIDPVAFSIGPLAVRWYGLAYVVGILGAWLLAERLVARDRLWPGNHAPASKALVGDFVVWATLGIVLGGRIGYVLVYDLARTISDPLSVFSLWNGGMSFHGGLTGVVVAMIIFSRRNGIATWSLIDTVASVAPLGIFFGRIANFINGELWGHQSDVPWAMVFPTGGPVARHPSQLYEAALEGLVLFAVLQFLAYRSNLLKKPGQLAGIFACGYGIARMVCELFREPDANIGYLTGGWLTMGMLLSVPVVLVGLWAIARARLAGEPVAASGHAGVNGGQE